MFVEVCGVLRNVPCMAVHLWLEPYVRFPEEATFTSYTLCLVLCVCASWHAGMSCSHVWKAEGHLHVHIATCKAGNLQLP